MLPRVDPFVFLTLLVIAAKLAIASQWGLLADEAYYWVWSQRLAAGYFDQPPAVAWWLAASTTALGDGPVGVRLVPALVGPVVVLLLARHAPDRWLWALWALGLPPLFFLTLFATPDATLLLGWAVALAGALAGGRGWLLAGLGAALAAESKLTGLAILPLLVVAVPRDLTSPWPWFGALILLAGIAPELAWNASNAWVTFSFPWRENVHFDAGPNPFGPLIQQAQQLAVVTPLAWIAAWVFWVSVAIRWRTTSRFERLCWMASGPLALLFLAASLFGASEAHWPAPALIGAGLGLSASRGRLRRLAEVGAWLAAMGTLLLVAHGLWRIVPLPDRLDPRNGLVVGALLAEPVAAWSLPEGASLADPHRVGARPVYTERYQEAAWLRYHAQLDAWPHPGCGRPNQFDLWGDPAWQSALFVRPATSGTDFCGSEHWERLDGPHRIDLKDSEGRTAARIDVFVLDERVWSPESGVRSPESGVRR